MTITIELDPEAEKQVLEAAAANGQDPETFARIAVVDRACETVKPPNELPERSLAEMLEGRVGRLRFGPADLSTRTEEAFGEIVVEKFRKQGLDV